jgi:hypothetical protein
MASGSLATALPSLPPSAPRVTPNSPRARNHLPIAASIVGGARRIACCNAAVCERKLGGIPEERDGRAMHARGMQGRPEEGKMATRTRAARARIRNVAEQSRCIYYAGSRRVVATPIRAEASIYTARRQGVRGRIASMRPKKRRSTLDDINVVSSMGCGVILPSLHL